MSDKTLVERFRYAKPTRQDMAVIIAYFNPIGYKNPKTNIQTVLEIHEAAGIPTFVGEIAFKDTPFLLPKSDRVFQYRTESYMFYKENLMMQVEKQVPETYTKVVLLDADILFESATWYDTVSKLLDSSHVVRPFKLAKCMDLTYKHIQSKTSVCHPGYAWAFQRKALHAIRIYEYAVIGGGDNVLDSQVFGKLIKHLAYQKDLNIVPLGLTKSTAEITIYHMYHGQTNNRQYDTRHSVLMRLLQTYSLSGASQLVERREDGILEWKPEYRDTMNAAQRRYLMMKKLKEMCCIEEQSCPVFLVSFLSFLAFLQNVPQSFRTRVAFRYAVH
jgi:hypothetical protein